MKQRLKSIHVGAACALWAAAPGSTGKISGMLMRRWCYWTGAWMTVCLAVAAEKSWEEKFRQVPQPDRIREYARVMSEEPHHAGSPAGDRVAEYVLARFREWGLEAQIEEFEALLPTPRERRLE